MFETLVADTLNEYLGDFVEGLDKSNVSTSVFAGELELRDLQLKSTAFESLGIPVTLAAGFVGRLKLAIPWKSLGSKPIVVKIEQVLACIRPTEEAGDGDHARFRRSALQADEEAWMSAEAAEADHKPNSAFMQKIIDNVQVHLCEPNAYSSG